LSLDALAYAMEGHLRFAQDFDSDVDGFSYFHVAEVTSTKIKVIGLAHVLPSGMVPLDASFRLENEQISYSVLIGEADEFWNGLTRTNCQQAVRLYACKGDKPPWKWNDPVQGIL